MMMTLNPEIFPFHIENKTYIFVLDVPLRRTRILRSSFGFRINKSTMHLEQFCFQNDIVVHLALESSISVSLMGLLAVTR